FEKAKSPSQSRCLRALALMGRACPPWRPYSLLEDAKHEYQSSEVCAGIVLWVVVPGRERRSGGKGFEQALRRCGSRHLHADESGREAGPEDRKSTRLN